VLPVRIRRDDPARIGKLHEDIIDTMLHRSPLTKVDGIPEDGNSLYRGSFVERGGVSGAASIVDDDYRERTFLPEFDEERQ
jgi:hypothetical protein